MPPSSGGTFKGDAWITIVSPGDDTCWTAASALKGEWIVPSPPGAAAALTYQRWFCPFEGAACAVAQAINTVADAKATLARRVRGEQRTAACLSARLHGTATIPPSRFD